MAGRDLLFELRTEELPPRTLLTLSSALTEGMLKGLDAAGVPHGKAHGFATPRRLAVKVAACGEFAEDRRVGRPVPPAAAPFRSPGAPTFAPPPLANGSAAAVCKLSRLATEKGWLPPVPATE